MLWSCSLAQEAWCMSEYPQQGTGLARDVLWAETVGTPTALVSFKGTKRETVGRSVRSNRQSPLSPSFSQPRLSGALLESVQVWDCRGEKSIGSGHRERNVDQYIEEGV